ncbi:MAG TPA: c-type cytochrome [Burkholderiales bacterium]|nr:c-type cytochrome [Burkholderiales bacterium]
MRHGLPGAAALAAALFVGAAGAADVEAGRQKAAVCAECHGPDGNSSDPAVPSLAGQPAQFLSGQLFFFREEYRREPRMSPAAKALSNSDMNDLAAYFASVKPAPPKHVTTPENEQRGLELTQKFRCVQCHSAGLQGQQHVPRIAGQQPEYLRAQLRGFKQRTRSDIDGYMTQMAQPLSDHEIDVLVDYIAGLRTPSRAAAGGSR